MSLASVAAAAGPDPMPAAGLPNMKGELPTSTFLNIAEILTLRLTNGKGEKKKGKLLLLDV